MQSTETAVIPQPKTYGPLGNLPQLDLHQPSQSILKLSYELGPIFKLKFPSGAGIFISSGELVEDVSDDSRFDKLVNAPLQKVRSFSGDGLFTSWTKEENWKKAHNILLPSFSQSAMRGYHAMMVDIALQLIQKWSRLNSDESIDVPEDMTRLTLDTIGLCGFNYRFNSFYRERPHKFIRAMTRALDEAMNKSNRLGIQDKLMVKKKQQFEKDIKTMVSLVDRIIKERKNSNQHGSDDLLSRMLNSSDPTTGEKLSDENIRYQIITFLIAGHETTSGLLSFTLYFLMKHHDKLAKAYEEIDRVVTGSVPTYEQVRQLKYIRMILNESLRLWPTAPLYSLYAKEDTVLAGKYPLKKRDVVNVFNLKLHRDIDAWGEDVEDFRPERFEDPKKVPHHAYKPFGNGQRACIGQQFALHEATLLIAMILKHFELIDHTNYQLKVKETLTLKPEGLTMKVQPRESAKSFNLMMAETSAASTKSLDMNKIPVVTENHNIPILVLYGSNMGTAEGFARGIAETASLHGFQSKAAPLDEYAGVLPKEGAVVIVSSSYNGNPPKNARKFVKWLKEADTNSLAGVNYAVFGCGDTNWSSTYQSIPNLIDEKLLKKGAVKIVKKGEADASGDFEAHFAKWHNHFWPSIMTFFGIKTDTQITQLNQGLTIQFLQEPAGTPMIALAKNKLQDVKRVLRRYELDENLFVKLQGDGLNLDHLPIDKPISILDLLSFHVNLQEPVTVEQLWVLAEFTVCPPHKKELEVMTEPAAYQVLILDKQITMLDLLDKYPACELPFERFLEISTPLLVPVGV